MNIWKVTAMMLRPDLWERGHARFPDELQLKDGDLRFYTDQAVCFRSKDDSKIVYTVPMLAWVLWILPLAHWLHGRVSRRYNETAKPTDRREAGGSA